MTVNELIEQLREKFIGDEEIYFETYGGLLGLVDVKYNEGGHPSLYFTVEEEFEE